jgi:hypothetical protein
MRVISRRLAVAKSLSLSERARGMEENQRIKNHHCQKYSPTKRKNSDNIHGNAPIMADEI